MKVDLTDLSPVKKKLAIEAETEEVEEETRAVLRAYRQKARLPGFRAGKAPLEVIRSRFAKEVAEEVRDRLVWRLFQQAAQEKGLKPLGEPSLEELEQEAGRSLSFKTTFEVLPEFELKSHKEVELRRPVAKVTDDDVDKALEELRQSRARLVVEEGRAAAEGDVVVADVEGTPEEGEPFKLERTQLEVGAQNNLPAFNEALPGAEAGAELEFPVEYPEDYGQKELAGKTVRFRLAVHEVKRRELPELDDEFAKDLGDFEDLAALTARVRDDLDKRKKAEAEHETRQAVLQEVMLHNPILLPEILVEHEIRRRLEEMVRGMMLQGMDPEKMEIDWAELRKRQEEPAKRAVHAQLILDAVAATEKIEVEKQVVEDRIRSEAQRLGEPVESLRSRLRKQGGMEALTNQLVREKSLDYLTSVANIQYSE